MNISRLYQNVTILQSTLSNDLKNKQTNKQTKNPKQYWNYDRHIVQIRLHASKCLSKEEEYQHCADIALIVVKRIPGAIEYIP